MRGVGGRETGEKREDLRVWAAGGRKSGQGMIVCWKFGLSFR